MQRNEQRPAPRNSRLVRLPDATYDRVQLIVPGACQSQRPAVPRRSAAVAAGTDCSRDLGARNSRLKPDTSPEPSVSREAVRSVEPCDVGGESRRLQRIQATRAEARAFTAARRACCVYTPAPPAEGAARPARRPSRQPEHGQGQGRGGRRRRCRGQLGAAWCACLSGVWAVPLATAAVPVPRRSQGRCRPRRGGGGGRGGAAEAPIGSNSLTSPGWP